MLRDVGLIWNCRLAQKYLQSQVSKVTKTQLYKEEMNKQIAKVKRWLSNFLIYLIPWEAKIKRIESLCPHTSNSRGC